MQPLQKPDKQNFIKMNYLLLALHFLKYAYPMKSPILKWASYIACLFPILSGCDEINYYVSSSPTFLHNQRIYLNDQSASISYSRFGKGDTTLLFIHGWGTNKSYWENQIDIFSKNYQVFAIDLPGFGQSKASRNSWTMENFGKDIASFIRKLKLKNVVLIGHCMAGSIAVETACLSQKDILAVIGVNTFLPSSVNPAYQNKLLKHNLACRKQQHIVPTGSEMLTYIKQENANQILRNRSVEKVPDEDIDITNVTKAIYSNYIAYDKIKLLRLKSYSRTIYLINNYNSRNFMNELDMLNVKYIINEIPDGGHFPMIETPIHFNRILEDVIQGIHPF